MKYVGLSKLSIPKKCSISTNRSASHSQPIRCPFSVSTHPIWFIITLWNYYSYCVPLKLVLLPGLEHLPYITTLGGQNRFIVLKNIYFFWYYSITTTSRSYKTYALYYSYKIISLKKGNLTICLILDHFFCFVLRNLSRKLQSHLKIYRVSIIIIALPVNLTWPSRP